MLINLLAIAVFAPLTLITLFFAAEIVGAMIADRGPADGVRPRDDGRGDGRDGAADFSMAVIVPAHNEEAGLRRALESIAGHLKADDLLLVVADNCADDTAGVARAVGAACVEREDPVRRGKGYALQFGLDHLAQSRAQKLPDVVVFMDADCVVETGRLRDLAREALRRDRPVQALYLMHAPSLCKPSARAPKQLIAAFAWLLMNRVRMSGLYQLFDVTRLTGAGMALPWPRAARLDLASGEIVEDLAMTLKLARDGAPPALNLDIVVASVFPETDEGVTLQRARWEHGSLRTAFSRAPGLLLDGVRERNWRLVALGLDILIPPLTLFAMALLGGFAASLLFGLLGARWAPGQAFWLLAVFGVSVALAWALFGRQTLPARDLPGLFQFLIGKVAVYGAKARASTRTWTRAARAGDAENGPGERRE